MAKRNAVLAALDRVVGAGAKNDPSIQQSLDDLVVQVGENVFYDVTPDAIANEYRVSVTLRMDDKELRALISDLGLAINTNTVRAQSMLVMMDEFFTASTNLQAPLEELEEFNYDAGASYRERERASTASNARISASNRASAGIIATDMYGGRAAAAAASSSQSLSASGSNRSNYSQDVDAKSHERASYKRLVKYQPRNVGPDRANYTFNEFKGQMTDYDIRIIDNTLFRSKYFGNKPITIDRLENSAELANYVSYARNEASADYMLIGTSVIYDAGVDPSTGMRACTGVATTKNFSTKTGEDIGSATQSGTAVGSTSDDCRARLAGKLATNLAGQVGKRVQDYFKRRNMYGSEFTIRLVGANLPLSTRVAFSEGLKSISGLENQVQRQASTNKLEIVASYRGSQPIDQAVASALGRDPRFGNLDAVMDGGTVIFCMSSCAKVPR